MKKIVIAVLFVCCAVIAVAQPVVAAEGSSGKTEQAQMLIDVNAATETELLALPGIGKVTAGRIIQHRTEQGPFATVDDLVQVKGIGSKVLEKIRPLVSVGS
ncbi:MAG: competence protein ComEA [Desulfuromonas sp.]|nr:MAG: competence protein ComEA [Desulfuromonas sp.]